MIHESERTRKRPHKRCPRPAATEETNTSDAPVSTRTRKALADRDNHQIRSSTRRRWGTGISPRVTDSVSVVRQPGGKGRNLRPKLPEQQRNQYKKSAKPHRSMNKNRRTANSIKTPAGRPSRNPSRKSTSGAKSKRIKRAEEKYRKTGDASAFSGFLEPFAKNNKEMNLGDWEYNEDKKRWCRVDKSTGFTFWAPTKESFL